MHGNWEGVQTVHWKMIPRKMLCSNRGKPGIKVLYCLVCLHSLRTKTLSWDLDIHFDSPSCLAVKMGEGN